MLNHKKKLLGYKTIKVHGMRYIIRKINPLLDFAHDKIPQIFTSYISKRPTIDETNPKPIQLQKILEDVKLVVQAGLVSPELVPVGKNGNFRRENGITIDDLFINEDLGMKLYLEILAHSLNKFRGLKGLFFSIKIKQLLYTEWQKSLNNVQAI